MKILTYTIHLEPEPEGGFTVTVPALHGCITYGRTLKEAKEMAKDAIKGYLESLSEHGEPIPQDDSLIDSVSITSSSIRNRSRTSIHA